MPSEQTPHDLRLERALLALILTDNSVLDRVSQLEPDHFFDAVHRERTSIGKARP